MVRCGEQGGDVKGITLKRVFGQSQSEVGKGLRRRLQAKGFRLQDNPIPEASS
jgi:hypothetical protein